MHWGSESASLTKGAFVRVPSRDTCLTGPNFAGRRTRDLVWLQGLVTDNMSGLRASGRARLVHKSHGCVSHATWGQESMSLPVLCYSSLCLWLGMDFGSEWAMAAKIIGSGTSARMSSLSAETAVFVGLPV